MTCRHAPLNMNVSATVWITKDYWSCSKNIWHHWFLTSNHVLVRYFLTFLFLFHSSFAYKFSRFVSNSSFVLDEASLRKHSNKTLESLADTFCLVLNHRTQACSRWKLQMYTGTPNTVLSAFIFALLKSVIKYSTFKSGFQDFRTSSASAIDLASSYWIIKHQLQYIQYWFLQPRRIRASILISFICSRLTIWQLHIVSKVILELQTDSKTCRTVSVSQSMDDNRTFRQYFFPTYWFSDSVQLDQFY